MQLAYCDVDINTGSVRDCVHAQQSDARASRTTASLSVPAVPPRSMHTGSARPMYAIHRDYNAAALRGRYSQADALPWEARLQRTCVGHFHCSACDTDLRLPPVMCHHCLVVPSYAVPAIRCQRALKVGRHAAGSTSVHDTRVCITSTTKRGKINRVKVRVMMHFGQLCDTAISALASQTPACPSTAEIPDRISRRCPFVLCRLQVSTRSRAGPQAHTALAYSGAGQSTEVPTYQSRSWDHDAICGRGVKVSTSNAQLRSIPAFSLASNTVLNCADKGYTRMTRDSMIHSIKSGGS